MKVKETKDVASGLGGGGRYVRVVELAPGETAPAGAEVVPDETPVSDWAPEG